MTRLLVETIEIESTGRATHALQHARERSVDDLGGRTVWCAAALPAGHARARALQAVVDRSCEARVRTRTLDLAAHEGLERLAQRLAALLSSTGSRGAALGEKEARLYAEAVEASESWLGGRIQPDDVVVLHDPLAAVLASATRERGAHAIWHVRPHRGHWGSAATEAFSFLQRYASPLDAYVIASFEAAGPGHVLERIAALMPAAGLVAERDIPLRRRHGPGGSPERTAQHDVGWSSVVAQIVESDRDECVGGRLHPRPAVAAR
jgi:hypothetical protein